MELEVPRKKGEAGGRNRIHVLERTEIGFSILTQEKRSKANATNLKG